MTVSINSRKVRQSNYKYYGFYDFENKRPLSVIILGGMVCVFATVTHPVFTMLACTPIPHVMHTSFSTHLPFSCCFIGRIVDLVPCPARGRSEQSSHRSVGGRTLGRCTVELPSVAIEQYVAATTVSRSEVAPLRSGVRRDLHLKLLLNQRTERCLLLS